MNINWETIVDGFRGFEKLALEFVEENEPQNGCSWKPTKETRDGNHDAILAREVSDTPKPDFAVFVGYANNVDVWWMEAKYSAEATQENSIISRYRLDATIVSAILSRNISKIIFVTNLEIASKTIADIRKALIFSNSCSEVKFYTNKNIDVDAAGITTLFGSVIEVVYFLKYLSTLNDAIKNIDDFKLAYHSFMRCELLKNEIISKFKNTFSRNADAEALCSCIYYTLSGIHRKLINDIPQSAETLNLLLDAELIRKNDDDFFVSWHDYYRDIFISHFSLKPYNGIHIPFEDVYHMKLQLELKSQENNTVEEALSKMEELFAEQKYYSIYYILENIFLEDTVKRQFKNGVCTQNYFMFFAYFAYANANAGTTYSGYDLFQRLYTEAASVSDTTVIIIRYIALWEIINSLYESNKYQEALQKIDCFNRMATAVQNNWKVLFGWDLPSIKYAVNTVKMFIDSENGINCLDKIPAKDFLFSKDIPFSTYRLILCNLTNDFDTAQKILREYNSLVQNRPDCDAKTKYMYNFAVIFLDCINDKVDISEVIVANNLLKENFVHDYNRHIFATSLLALTKGDLPLCEKYRLEYMKTQRPLKVRQLAFEAAYSALVYLHKHQKMAAINELEKEVTLFAERSTYLPVISHNIKYINQYEFSLDDLEFYLGGHLREGKYYIDIRMLY